MVVTFSVCACPGVGARKPVLAVARTANASENSVAPGYFPVCGVAKLVESLRNNEVRRRPTALRSDRFRRRCSPAQLPLSKSPSGLDRKPWKPSEPTPKIAAVGPATIGRCVAGFDRVGLVAQFTAEGNVDWRVREGLDEVDVETAFFLNQRSRRERQRRQATQARIDCVRERVFDLVFGETVRARPRSGCRSSPRASRARWTCRSISRRSPGCSRRETPYRSDCAASIRSRSSHLAPGNRSDRVAAHDVVDERLRGGVGEPIRASQ